MSDWQQLVDRARKEPAGSNWTMENKCTCGGDQVALALHRSWCQLNKPMEKKIEPMKKPVIEVKDNCRIFHPTLEELVDKINQLIEAVNQKEGGEKK